jgi:glycosyltransferase involved in cell wall biosynthesis
MRVLHLTTEFPPVIWGGLGTAVGGLVCAMAREGISVGVLLVGGILATNGTYAAWQPVAPEQLQAGFGKVTVTRDGITFFQVAPEEGIESGLRLARLWRPHVIHLHTAWLWPIAAAIRAEYGVPIVFTVHSLDRAEYESGGFFTQWEVQEDVINSVDRVIAISGSERDLIVRYCPTALPQVRVVGNGIDDSPLARTAAYRMRCSVPVIMFSGRFVDRKGIHDLLEALPFILDRAPDVRVVLVGGYGSGEEMESSWLPVALRPHRKRVQFTGWLPPDGVARCYANADILAVPSWYEPFGMVILEGMLYGLAIAATTVGGPAEILKHECTGLLVPPKDVDALSTALLRLTSDSTLRVQLGRAAARKVRRHWLWPRLIEQFRSVYREVAAQRPIFSNQEQ